MSIGPICLAIPRIWRHFIVVFCLIQPNIRGGNKLQFHLIKSPFLDPTLFADHDRFVRNPRSARCLVSGSGTLAVDPLRVSEKKAIKIGFEACGGARARILNQTIMGVGFNFFWGCGGDFFIKGGGVT